MPECDDVRNGAGSNWFARGLFATFLLLAIGPIFIPALFFCNQGDVFFSEITSLCQSPEIQGKIAPCLVIYFLGFTWLEKYATGGRINLRFVSSNGCLLVLLILAAGRFVFGQRGEITDTRALLLPYGMVVGKGVSCLGRLGGGIHNMAPRVKFILNCLIGAVASSSWLHLDMSHNYYHGSRWMGLWDNPNTYGALMATGLVLASAGLPGMTRAKDGRQRGKAIVLLLVIGMMSVGLVMSYSRGAWLAAAGGLLYLAWCHGWLDWKYLKYLLSCMAIGLVFVICLWGSTPDSAPWFIKRADLGRPSAQHRVSAWRAGLAIMRDHPFGVGWGNAVKIYQDQYSPPADGAAAITTNDYLMIGAELGIPALLCFVVYLALGYRHGPCPRRWTSAGEDRKAGKMPEGFESNGQNCLLGQQQEFLRAACLASALVFIVVFWFDGGLFKLPTAAVFWVLLELGKTDG